MRSRRVANIWFRDTDDFGSAYFLTDRLVLAAGHVAGAHAKGAPCIVRRYNLDDPLDAKIAWVSRHPDVALIKLDTAATIEDCGDPPIFGRPAVSGGAEAYETVSIGFPEANVDADAWIEKIVRGTATELFGHAFDVTVRDLKPTDATGWSGLSGAALFSRGLLFAIFKSVPTAWGGTSLNAVAIWPLLENPEFRETLADGGMHEPEIRALAHSRYYRTIAQKVGDQYFLVNRDRQTGALEKVLSKDERRAFLIEGKTRDRLDFLMQRFAGEPCLKALLGDMKAPNAIVKLTWPQDIRIDAESEFAKLREFWAKKLVLPADARTTAEDFAKGLGPRRVAIWWQLDLDRMGEGHADLLRSWTGFCMAIQAFDAGLYWFACRVEGDEVLETRMRYSFRRPPGPDPNVLLIVHDLVERGLIEVFEPLLPIRADNDLEPWLGKLSVLNDNERQDLSTELAARLGVLETPLDDFRRDVEATLGTLDA